MRKIGAIILLTITMGAAMTGVGILIKEDYLEQYTEQIVKKEQKKRYVELLRQKGYIHRAAIILSTTADDCKSCQRKKLSNQEYLELITKIK